AQYATTCAAGPRHKRICAPCRATAIACSTTFDGSSYPVGEAMLNDAPSITAPCASDVATLLPSPTNVIVRPAHSPHTSFTVCKSANAWHGCSVSLSAFTTCRRGAGFANCNGG